MNAPKLQWGTAALAGAFLLLALQVGLYVWMAPRAFEFTDEAFYLLHFLHWREFQGNVSFFGAYFDLPFRILGQDVAAIRIFSLVLLLACSGYAAASILRHQSACLGMPMPTPVSAFVLSGMAGSLLYFSYLTTLRAPSYNLGALCASLMATGLLLNAMLPTATSSARSWQLFGYGLALGACGLNKASAGLAVAFLHSAFLIVLARHWLFANIWRLALLAALGVGTNVVLLTLAAPHWLQQLVEGVALVASTDGRGLVGLLNHARWDLQKVIYQHGHWALLAVLVYGGCIWAQQRLQRPFVVWADLGLVIAAVWFLADYSEPGLWWPVLALASALLAAGALWRLSGRIPEGSFRTQFGLVVLLLALPLALSFGTNMPVLEHAKINAVFGVLALICALALAARTSPLQRSTALAVLVLMCLPGLAFQWRALASAEGAYRQLQSLGSQSEEVLLGERQVSLLVDVETAAALSAVRKALTDAGWTIGSRMIDMTGDGPGWIYAMGARPVGVAWLLGGYPGSENTAAKVLASQVPETLRGAWVLASDANPRRISNWQELLLLRLGAPTHEKVATVTIAAPYRWSSDAPAHVDLQLWRPLP